MANTDMSDKELRPHNYLNMFVYEKIQYKDPDNKYNNVSYENCRMLQDYYTSSYVNSVKTKKLSLKKDTIVHSIALSYEMYCFNSNDQYTHDIMCHDASTGPTDIKISSD
jgi:hypothetical protein